MITIQNKWENVYWFSRMLINSDKYVPIAKSPQLLLTIASSLRVIASNTTDKDTLLLQKQALRNLIEERYQKAASMQNRVRQLLKDLDSMIQSSQDMDVFIVTCEHIIMPLNQAITNIPNDDREFTINIAKSYLDVQGTNGLASIVALWDDLGVKGCLTAERTEIIKAFTTLRVLLSKTFNLSDYDKDIVLTAFTQEFERRAAQKRKQRAGGSLEDVTNFILAYYNIKQAEDPAHFQADIEVDNWIKTKDNWLIGISCKRTIRERWKQVSSAESQILSKYKIKHIFHVVTYDEDLSDDKLSLLGGHRHIFYLPDSSRRLSYASQHIGLKDYVRPISELVNDLNKHLR